MECKFCGEWAGVGFRQHDECAKAAADGKTTDQIRALRLDLPLGNMEPTHICSNCRSRIRPVQRADGSGAIEVLLWLLFLVPGIIYSIWRASTNKPKCPICAAAHPVPLGTPAAESLALR